jgi:hypothetical protein
MPTNVSEFGGKHSNESYTLLRVVIEFLSLLSTFADFGVIRHRDMQVMLVSIRKLRKNWGRTAVLSLWA